VFCGLPRAFVHEIVLFDRTFCMLHLRVHMTRRTKKVLSLAGASNGVDRGGGRRESTDLVTRESTEFETRERVRTRGDPLFRKESRSTPCGSKGASSVACVTVIPPRLLRPPRALRLPDRCPWGALDRSSARGVGRLLGGDVPVRRAAIDDVAMLITRASAVSAPLRSRGLRRSPPCAL
jgi:hypothetical protein